jgi:hypothetical protein
MGPDPREARALRNLPRKLWASGIRRIRSSDLLPSRGHPPDARDLHASLLPGVWLGVYVDQKFLHSPLLGSSRNEERCPISHPFTAALCVSPTIFLGAWDALCGVSVMDTHDRLAKYPHTNFTSVALDSLGVKLGCD